MKLNIKRAVENFAKKDLKFIQPLFEAITNSLEAGASLIEVELHSDTTVSQEVDPKLIGFSVRDNGEGFTKDNRESFLELWSDKKISLGCKGSGRFTWLSVFENVTIVSEITSENKRITIPFSLAFQDDDISLVDYIPEYNTTTISFSDVTKRFYDAATGHDARCVLDVDSICDEIRQNLLLKLFLLKKEGKDFIIRIKYNSAIREIINSSIPDLELCLFSVYSDITKTTYDFELYYHFIDDRRNSKNIYYCAHNRIVKKEDDESVEIACALPNKESFNMLLCANYLDDRVNDSRDDFPNMSNKKHASCDCPLLYKDIRVQLRQQIQSLLVARYPSIIEMNREQMSKAIEAAPYLTKYIRDNDDIVMTQSNLIKKAQEEFNRHKGIARTRFDDLLANRDINADAFDMAVTELSEVAAAELGEYILYREAIIKALELAIIDLDKKEKFIHDIFMPMKTASFSEDTDKHLLSNLWLLDDKFMTYTYAASDKTINQIREAIFQEAERKFKDATRPDLSIFFNKQGDNKDLIILEFKGLNASLDEKTKALTELSRNIKIVRDNFDGVNTIWGYIITTIDEEFRYSIEAEEVYKALFVADSDIPLYYRYLGGSQAHIYIIDIKSITTDAFARNKVFMDILKKR